MNHKLNHQNQNNLKRNQKSNDLIEPSGEILEDNKLYNNTTTTNGQMSNFNLYSPPEVKINIIE